MQVQRHLISVSMKSRLEIKNNENMTTICKSIYRSVTTAIFVIYTFIQRLNVEKSRDMEKWFKIEPPNLHTYNSGTVGNSHSSKLKTSPKINILSFFFSL